MRQTRRGHTLGLVTITRVRLGWMMGRRGVGEVTAAAKQHHRMAYHSVSSVGAMHSHAAHRVTRDFPCVLDPTATVVAHHPQRLFPPLRQEVRCYATTTQNARVLRLVTHAILRWRYDYSTAHSDACTPFTQTYIPAGSLHPTTPSCVGATTIRIAPRHPPTLPPHCVP